MPATNTININDFKKAYIIDSKNKKHSGAYSTKRYLNNKTPDGFIKYEISKDVCGIEAPKINQFAFEDFIGTFFTKDKLINDINTNSIVIKDYCVI